MKILRKIVVFWLLTAIVLLCIACQKEPEITGLKEGQYYTYYVNSSGTALVSRIYEPQATDTLEIVTELLAQCQTAPESGEGRRAIPANVVVAEPPQLEDRIVNLYFDTTYTTMDQVTELLCKAAMAKTITQLEAVDYIRIHINGEVPILPAEKTLWSGSDFLDNTGDDTNKYIQTELVLYFGNGEGKALETEVREVVYSSTLALARVVLNQLIEGPQVEGMTATLPKNLKIQGVSVRDGVCYVDFDATFLEEPVNVTDQVEIYSIVNSLTELSSVHQVQITVNGSPDVVLRNNISLSGRFEKDLNMIAVQEDPVDETQEPTTPEATVDETVPTMPEETEPITQRETEPSSEETTAEETIEDETEASETVSEESGEEGSGTGETSTEETSIEAATGL